MFRRFCSQDLQNNKKHFLGFNWIMKGILNFKNKVWETNMAEFKDWIINFRNLKLRIEPEYKQTADFC